MLIQAYQKEWPQYFSAIEQILRDTLANLDISVEHIGSTAVPGLAAKPIIDIDVSFGPQVEFGEIQTRLAAIGYYHNGDQGIKNREVFKRLSTPQRHTILDGIRHHLYVCPHYSLELHRHLVFRDTLRAKEAVRHRYEAMKYSIAKQANQEYKLYADLKEMQAKEWINSIIEEAGTGRSMKD